MPLRELRFRNFRAFEDSGPIRVPSMLALVGRNDTGKSAALHAMDWFFKTPRKPMPVDEIHNREANREVVIELAFDPSLLSSSEVTLDAQNVVELTDENLLTADGLLRLRLRATKTAKGVLEIKIRDLNDPDLFAVAISAKEKDLLPLLTARGLDAIPAGKETNAEKRAALRADALEKGATFKEDWAPLGDKEQAIRDILPAFSFFKDDARYDVDETPVQSTFKTVVDEAMKEAPIAQTVKDAADQTLKKEFDQVFEYLSRLTSQVKSLTAVADMDWKKAVAGVDVTWTDAFDADVPYELRGAGIRRLFMVAYFQYQAAKGLHDPTGPKYIFCIEEPEVHLHPGAQRELLDALAELNDGGHSVVFTTHSPVFASMVPCDGLALITRSSMTATVTQTPELDISMVAEELGVEASDRLIGRNYVVLVEGLSDQLFFEEALKLLHDAGETTLDPSKICFLQCGGMGNLEFMATTEKLDAVGLKWAAIADSDRQTAGDPICNDEANELLGCLPASCCHFHVLERTTLENYYDETSVRSVARLDAKIPAYGQLTDAAGQVISKKRRKRALKNEAAARGVCIAMGAAGLLANSITPSSPHDSRPEFVTMFEDIREHFGL